MNKDEALSVLGVMLSAGQAYSAANPSISTIRRGDWASDDDLRMDIRHGEIAATAITLGVGAYVASVFDSLTPFYASIIVAASYVGLYEWALATRPKKGGTNASEGGNEEADTEASE